MKIKLISFTIILFAIALLRIDKSYSYFIEQVKVAATVTAAECFEECGEVFTIAGFIEEPQLLFYTMGATNEVGFVLNNVYDYDAFEYELTYDHITEFGNLTEKVEGDLQNPEGKGTILEEGIFLGTETTGGTRVLHVGVEKVNLKVNLMNSGVTEKTLDETLNF